MIDEKKLDAFRRLGVVKFKGLIDYDIVAALQEKIRKRMEVTGVAIDGMWISKDRDRWQVKRVKKIREPLKKTRALRNIVTHDVLKVANILVPGARQAPLSYPHLLLTPPNSDDWKLPGDVWHTDLPRTVAPGCPGVQMFACIDYTKPKGGATLVAAGSHQFINDAGFVRSKNLKKKLKYYDYFKTLLNGKATTKAYMSAQQVAGISCQILELTGAPGDVWFTDLRILHTLSLNISETPRLAVTQRFFAPRSFELAQLPATRDD